MIDASIKLDHFTIIPFEKLEKIEKQTIDNAFAFRVTRDIVADHLYLYGNEQRTIQRLTALWSIGVREPKFITNSSKK